MQKIKLLTFTVETVKNNIKETIDTFVSMHFHLRIQSKEHYHTENSFSMM